MGAAADGGGVLHIFVGLRSCLSAPCVDSPFLGGAGVRVGVFIPIVRFGHVGFVVVADGFACVEIVLQRYVAKVSNLWTMGNSRVEQLRQGGAWKQLSSGKE